ncbi:MAG: polymorphic toxin type 35 domain-containing protein [Maledivibacter sp.]|jgi:hypothetical protein|nr:polymorphic toxin type 35 domain-containing protein [Maledivibacter sp.]
MRKNLFIRTISYVLTICILTGVFVNTSNAQVKTTLNDDIKLAWEIEMRTIQNNEFDEELLSKNSSPTRSAAAGAVVIYAIPGIGEVALAVTAGVIVIGGITLAGGWLYNKIMDWINSNSQSGTIVMSEQELIDDAMDALDNDTNKQNHIKKPKHDWDKIIAGSVTWEKIRQVVQKVMEEGSESSYGSATKRVLNIAGETVTVTFKKVSETLWRISDAWVNK